ncbi:MAG TPA: hypothetical protein VEP69_03185 [Thermodesulfovibrionales bacterium]|nr:hypothetical protein [Thermodesulfovibrionales bacterium]
MKPKITPLQRRLYLIAALILLAGLVSSALIYATAGDDEQALGYVIINGHTYPVKHEDSKIYRHDLELYGGKWNVAADQFTRWFGGLWRGRSLAFTVGCIAILASLVIFALAKTSPPDTTHDTASQ